MSEKGKCIVCGENSNNLPLLALEYQGKTFYICPQHFPILIHQPQKLVGVLPGAERLQPHAHDD